MAFELVTSRGGYIVAKVNGRYLHSPYNPENECQRFLTKSFNEPPAKLLILGESFGYLFKAARKLYPKSKIWTVSYADFSKQFVNSWEPSWKPDANFSVFSFFQANLTEELLSGLKIIEWPAAAAAFPQISSEVGRALNQHLRELNGDIMTISHFGRRWLRNAFLNFASASRFFNITGKFRAVLIAASGPSLEQNLAAIKANRNKLKIWALPSALDCLIERQIVPDLIILSDPGYYAGVHLESAFCFGDSSLPVAAPLGAINCFGKPNIKPIAISLGDFFENDIFKRTRIEPIKSTSHGTVAGLALHLALIFAEGPIIFAGLDLCYFDIQGHCRPNSFRKIFETGSGRLRPLQNAVFDRALTLAPEKSSGNCRLSLPMKTYAGWFDRESKYWQGRVFRLLPSPVKISGFIDLSSKDLARLLPDEPATDNWLTQAGPLNRKDRVAILAEVKNGWLTEIMAIEKLLTQKNLAEAIIHLKSRPIFTFLAKPEILKLQKQIDETDKSAELFLLKKVLEKTKQEVATLPLRHDYGE